MRYINMSFPHPVLGIGDAVNSNIELIDTEIKSLDDIYDITIKLKHDNEDLNQLIKTNRAEYICEVTCSNTLFRDIFKSNLSQIKFSLPKKAVKGRVEFLCLLVAKDEIKGYFNNKCHSDYIGYSFDLEKGDILAYFGEFTFNADIQYEKLKSVSSFMEIVERSDIDYTKIDLTKSKILVELPSEVHNHYLRDSISEEPKFAPVFHSSIVLNALLIALYNLEEHKKYLWAEVLEYRLKNEKQFQSLSVKEKENVPEIAQRLLGDPFKRLLEGLNIIVELSNFYEV